MYIQLTPIAFVKNTRQTPIDDEWGVISSEIVLAENMPNEVFLNIDLFSHLEIIYYFDQVKKEDIVFAGKPRGINTYPTMGILAQRKKDRPNQLGSTIVELLQHTERTIQVKYLDAIDGTPVLDIKPVFQEFQPKGKIIQPAWVKDLMKEYW